MDNAAVKEIQEVQAKAEIKILNRIANADGTVQANELKTLAEAFAWLHIPNQAH